eukprot:TRINITY_DN935_c0_g1_i1.p1 TRINITY_DN935_c0_g1~~TRINITY_DN935_c0_g1_i1.p1  ORF type:complete len:529 (+),score=188.32 TRINITY_DN935_c0_g1_i1:60-1646(+)
MCIRDRWYQRRVHGNYNLLLKQLGKMKYIALLLLIAVVFARKTPDQWKDRVIYQIVTDRFAGENTQNCDLAKQPYYCGGTFTGIIKQLDYIKGMGFDAIWISPIVENTENGFHGYWLKDLYKINSYFGGESGFKDLIKACHAKDVWIMIDVVANHAGPVGFDYSQINPFNKAEHYHDNCDIVDWKNQWQVENCRLAGLPDLKQENSWVKDTLVKWIRDLVTNYDIDGIRIDTIPEVPKWFWSEFVQSANCYAVGECFDSDAKYVLGYQEQVGSLLNYPVYFTARSSFGYGQSMRNFESLYSYLKQLEGQIKLDQSLLATFVDNHDNPRFLNYQSDSRKFKSFIAYTLGCQGIPIVYYGSEQGYAGGQDPYNRETLWPNYNKNHELYKYIQLILSYRKKLAFQREGQLQCYADDDFYAFQRGQVFFAFTNKNYNIKRKVNYNTLNDGKYCNIFWKTDCVQVSGHQFDINMDNGEAKIYIPAGKLLNISIKKRFWRKHNDNSSVEESQLTELEESQDEEIESSEFELVDE